MQEFISDNRLLMGVVFTTFAFSLSFLLFYRIGSEFFNIYKRNFLETVDKGFRDSLIYLDPTQVFTLTIVALAISTPLLMYFTSITTTLIGVAVVLLAPKFILDRVKKSRADEFIKQLPDALTSMSASLRSGLNLMKALNQVVKNQPDPIAAEFAQVIVEYRVGKDLNESLEELARRLSKDELILLNSSIKISREIGGNLADTLDSLASTLREKSKVEGKVRALTAMGKAQGMLSIGLPFVVGYVFYKIEPDTMVRLFTTTLGLWILFAMLAMMGVAWVTITRITRIDI